MKCEEYPCRPKYYLHVGATMTQIRKEWKFFQQVEIPAPACMYVLGVVRMIILHLCVGLTISGMGLLHAPSP